MQEFDVVVIGPGYAGLTAAKRAAARSLRTANVEAMFAGGSGSVSIRRTATGSTASLGGASTAAVARPPDRAAQRSGAGRADGAGYRIAIRAEDRTITCPPISTLSPGRPGSASRRRSISTARSAMISTCCRTVERS